MNLLNPLALLFALLAVPIILLYLLRLQRREQPVSSTLLWRQVIMDREANTLWQKLRKNLLLFLQLLTLLFFVCADSALHQRPIATLRQDHAVVGCLGFDVGNRIASNWRTNAL